MHVGQRVARLRRLQGFTQADLAERSGVSLAHIKAVERGVRELGSGAMEAIAAGLGVPVLALTSDEYTNEVTELVSCILPLERQHRRLIIHLCAALKTLPAEDSAE